MEKRHGGEIVSGVLSALGILALSQIALGGFSDRIKEEAYERQKGICPLCGEKLSKKCEGHHRVPKSLGGTNASENCVMLDGERSKDCHEVADRRALDHGIILGPDNTFIPISEAPVTLFRNEAVREKTLRKFTLGEAIRGTIEVFHRKHKRQKYHKGHHKGNKGRR